ncbi:MAG: D-alanine--D-alanine ligase [Zoogloeaceae bacterium]|jgi:D-alanine-D-alanine ligase|nr:D-alanine--D-alanine ligase [Zoogloeaceae bacterium]
MSENFGKVAVLMGGTSSERAVSLQSGAGVLAALQRQGVDAHPFDPASDRFDDLRGYDCAFIALHGRHGEDGTIQGVLELMGIPFTGPGVMASAVGMDKFRTKLLWQAVGLPVPDYELLDGNSDFDAVEKRLGLPLFVKPVREGSSVGVSMVTKAGALAAAYAEAARHDSMVIAEAGIMGGEYTVAILGDEALPIVKIEPATPFYDYEAKYLRDDTRYFCPCGLSPEKEAEIQAGAKKAFQILGGSGWSRVDFLMDTAGKHYFLEVNTSPGMTTHSLVPMAAKHFGISYEELVLKVLSQVKRDEREE